MDYRKNFKKITIVIPLYNEAHSLPSLVKVLDAISSTMENQYYFRYLFVNDGSRDNSLQIIKDMRRRDNRISYINLSRNHGKELAMAAGIDLALEISDAIIFMDADLQHPPKYIPEMIQYWEQGYDDVYGIRIIRKGENIFRRISSTLFYKLLSYLANEVGQKDIGDFRLLSKRALYALASIRDKNRYTKGLFNLIGYTKIPFEYESDERNAGSSSFNFTKLIELGIDGITSFSIKPLRLASMTGIIGSLFSCFYLLYIIAKTLIFGESVTGFPTLASLILILGSLNLFCIGILGEYVGRIYLEVKDRPLYFIDSYEID